MVMADALMKENVERKGLLFPLHCHNLLSKAFNYLNSVFAILKSLLWKQKSKTLNAGLVGWLLHCNPNTNIFYIYTFQHQRFSFVIMDSRQLHHLFHCFDRYNSGWTRKRCPQQEFLPSQQHLHYLEQTLATLLAYLHWFYCSLGRKLHHPVTPRRSTLSIKSNHTKSDERW